MQLRKNPPFEINPDAPFENDLLEQRPSIELLTKFVQSTEQPFVITIEAPWGWGKTKFIERWKAHLEKEKHACLYFNAWENDFVSDPLVAFIGELRPVVELAEGGKNADSPIRKKLAHLQKLGGALAKKAGPVFVKGVATKLLGSEAVKDISEAVADSAGEIANFLSESVQEQIERYDDEKQDIRKFRETLKELAEKVTSGDGKQRQVVFFVDELDRCRPDFAMTLLERIKHLFNSDRVVFVLALDRQQLRNIVRILYGSGDNADIYLRRFIDFSYQLPKPSTRAFAEMLIARIGMKDFFQGRMDANTEYERLLLGFVGTANWLNLDLRTQEQCFTRLNAIARLWSKNNFLPTDALSVLVGLKVGKPELFDALKLGAPLPDVPEPESNDSEDEFPILVKRTLEAVFGPKKTYEAKSQKMRREFDRNQFGRDREADLFMYLGSHRSELMRLIEFSSRLQ